MMTVKQLRDLYIRGAGSTEDAKREQWLHLNNSYREICAIMDFRDLKFIGLEVDTVAEQDWVGIDAAFRSIEQIVNMEDGLKLIKEPGGMKGRKRYLENSENRPPLGSPSFWEAEADRIWLRDTPRDIISLSIDGKMYPPELDDDTDQCSHLIIPADYDMAFVYLALAGYFAIHPPVVKGSADLKRSRDLKTEAMGILQGHRDQNMEENRDQIHYTRQLGYGFNVR
jgi:hypothetical protein